MNEPKVSLFFFAREFLLEICIFNIITTPNNPYKTTTAKTKRKEGREKINKWVKWLVFTLYHSSIYLQGA